MKRTSTDWPSLGLTMGCTPTTFCPKAPVRRDEMASFLTRAVPLTDGAGDNYFRDDDGTTHEADIDRAAAAGITTGCGTWRYCIADSVTRGQMAGFLHRVEKPITAPPHPAPTGPQKLYRRYHGVDAGNCVHGLGVPVPDDPPMPLDDRAATGTRIVVAAGTYPREGSSARNDVTITGDPGGGIHHPMRRRGSGVLRCDCGRCRTDGHSCTHDPDRRPRPRRQCVATGR